jgi:hypothetical protein
MIAALVVVMDRLGRCRRCEPGASDGCCIVSPNAVELLVTRKDQAGQRGYCAMVSNRCDGAVVVLLEFPRPNQLN